MSDKILWKPSEKEIINSRMYKFLSRISRRFDLPDNEYATIHKWSVERTDKFWAEIWDYCAIKYSKNYEKVVDDPQDARSQMV
ncbi:MAG: acetyl-coenzyme A synthetase N-terminal domain-containing protein [Bacteroidales bacterium]